MCVICAAAQSHKSISLYLHTHTLIYTEVLTLTQPYIQHVGIQPILVHMSKNDSGKYDYSLLSVNFLIEVAKTIFALGTIVFLGTGSSRELYTSFRAFNRDAYQCRLLLVPAALYAINNYLKFAMQIYFSPTASRMISNLKVFTIAVLMKVR